MACHETLLRSQRKSAIEFRGSPEGTVDWASVVVIGPETRLAAAINAAVRQDVCSIVVGSTKFPAMVSEKARY